MKEAGKEAREGARKKGRGHPPSCVGPTPPLVTTRSYLSTRRRAASAISDWESEIVSMRFLRAGWVSRAIASAREEARRDGDAQLDAVLEAVLGKVVRVRVVRLAVEDLVASESTSRQRPSHHIGARGRTHPMISAAAVRM